MFCEPSAQLGRLVRMNESSFKDQLKKIISDAKKIEDKGISQRDGPLHTIEIKIKNNEISLDELRWIREEMEKLPPEMQKKMLFSLYMRSKDITDPSHVKRNTPDFEKLDET
jgi:hypothetical protein